MARSFSTLAHALLALFFVPAVALAGADSFGVGTGKDGALSVNAANTVVNVYSSVTTSLAQGDLSIPVSSTAGIAANDLLLVIQMAGDPIPDAQFVLTQWSIDLTNDPVGRWELARVSSISGTTVTLSEPLVHFYAANATQIVRVPEYSSVSLSAPGTLVPKAWDGSTGGIVALLVNGTLALNSGAGVDATGKGFRGGLPVVDPSFTGNCWGDAPAPSGAQKGEGVAAAGYGPLHTGPSTSSNGGGGGDCLHAGGGGGGNGGMGGRGGNSDGYLAAWDVGNRAVGGGGGPALSNDLRDHLLMGGGGGAGEVTSTGQGPGGAGGGIVFIRATSLAGPGSILASGAPGSDSPDDNATGGGGAGGSIYLRVVGSATCGTLLAAGAAGGNAFYGTEVGPGGGGGGGRVLLEKSSGTCDPSAAVLGGNPGVTGDLIAASQSWGATAGNPGGTSALGNGFPAVLPTPVVTAPADGTVTSQNRPTFSGTVAMTGPADTQVVIRIDRAELGRVTPDASGTWTLTPMSWLQDGAYSVDAVSVSSAEAVQSAPSSSGSLTIDTSPPSWSSAADVVVEATGASGAIVSYTAPTATDARDGAVVASCAPSSGTLFPIGTRVVTCTASDRSGNSSSVEFRVIVRDTTPPALALPSDPIVEAIAASGAAVQFSGSAQDIVDGAVALGCVPSSGSTFPIGTTEVSCSAIDAHGNSASGTLQVTVRDTTAPRLTLPSDLVVEATGASGAAVQINGSGQDAVDGALALGCVPSSGSTFPLGTTNVSCSATDAHGNSASGTFHVLVQDTLAPVLTLPSDFTVEATSAEGALVHFTGTAADVVSGAPAVLCLPSSDTVFALGTTEVSCSAADNSGNTADATFQVTVKDTTAPALTCPRDISVDAEDAAGAHVSFTPTATDAVTTSPTLNATPASGSLFLLGSTTVQVSASDAAGNVSTCSFQVQVTQTGGSSADAGSPGTTPQTPAGGCGCSSGASGETALMGLGALVYLLARRRRLPVR